MNVKPKQGEGMGKLDRIENEGPLIYKRADRREFCYHPRMDGSFVWEPLYTHDPRPLVALVRQLGEALIPMVMEAKARGCGLKKADDALDALAAFDRED